MTDGTASAPPVHDHVLHQECASGRAPSNGHKSAQAGHALQHPITEQPHDSPTLRMALRTGSCTQWEIYDEYIKDLERQRMEETLKSKGGKKSQAAQHAGGAGGAAAREKDDKAGPLQSPALLHSAQILDRMANQNMFEEIAMDFKVGGGHAVAAAWAGIVSWNSGSRVGSLVHASLQPHYLDHVSCPSAV